jgi:hypothetical protein
LNFDCRPAKTLNQCFPVVSRFFQTFAPSAFSVSENRPQSLVGRASARADVRQTVLAARADARPTGYAAPLVAVRKNLDLVWVWFYKDGVPTANQLDLHFC